MKPIRTPIGTAALALGILAAAPAIAGEIETGMPLGRDGEAIVSALRDNGYRMVEFDHEGGRIEVTAVKDGRRVEVRIDPETGMVRRVGEDD